MTRSEVFKELRRRGAARAVVSFSGGNDEGGVDGITLYAACGAAVGKVEDHHVGYRADPVTQQWGPSRPLTSEESRDNELHEALSEPVYDRYHSFAGEYYVRGKVEWDVIKKKVVIEGDEEVPQTDSFSEEV